MNERENVAEAGWIPVTEALPTDGGPKIVFGLTETMGWGYSMERYDLEWGWTGRHTVTHWQPVPSPPSFELEPATEKPDREAAIASLRTLGLDALADEEERKMEDSSGHGPTGEELADHRKWFAGMTARQPRPFGEETLAPYLADPLKDELDASLSGRRRR